MELLIPRLTYDGAITLVKFQGSNHDSKEANVTYSIFVMKLLIPSLTYDSAITLVRFQGTTMIANITRLSTSYTYLPTFSPSTAHVKRPLLSFGPKASTKLRTCPAIVCKELRLSSYLLSDFGSESAQMTIDGAFSTAWLKNLQKPMGSSVLSQENGSRSSCDAFQFIAQPSSIPGCVLQLAGSSYLLRATAWELYGSAPLARVNALVYATCFADASRYTDLYQINLTLFEFSSSADVALAYVKLIQHLAVFKGYQGLGVACPTLSNEAFAALKVAEDKFLSVSKSRIQLLKLQLLHEHALHRGHLKLAQQVCDEFGVLASSVIGVDMELKTEASLRHARTLLAANQFSQATNVAHSLFCMCYKFNLQVENATVLLLLAEIHKAEYNVHSIVPPVESLPKTNLKSGNAVLGLPYALASLSYCQSFNLDLLEASVTLTLAELWLSLGSNHAKRASTLIHRALPMILGHGGLELRARAYIAEAKCYLSDPSFSVTGDPEVVLDPLRQASEELQVLENSNSASVDLLVLLVSRLDEGSSQYHELAAEAFYLMAIVFDRLGQLEEREVAAATFKKYVIALEHPEDEEDPILNGI
ncbi:hypothetical protein HHK36_012864 [Tetracentron sinense]|uniref:Anaphase-promoting complex subunit 5 n=1 Tax=Tetracentron sinense TaxID=13715 RepID=A0A835DEX9_TETSI|nr:hypothetical protein HHK36_012864 [Tetracentron sinense]